MKLRHLSLALSIILLPTVAMAQDDNPILPPPEQEAAYLVLESINPTIPWRSLYPDDLCLSGPHGIVCDLFPDSTYHITELNFGYASGFSRSFFANSSAPWGAIYPDDMCVPGPHGLVCNIFLSDDDHTAFTLRVTGHHTVFTGAPCGPNPTLPALLPFPRLRKLLFYRCFTAATASTLPPDLWSLPSLEELLIVDNPSLSGQLTAHIAALPRLRRLIVSRTGVSGGIPEQIGILGNLEQLDLSRNHLEGIIPPAVGQCGMLKILNLSGNQLTGTIPMEIGELADLVELDLSYNMISGPVPAALGKLHRLRVLCLNNNQLTANIMEVLKLFRLA